MKKIALFWVLVTATCIELCAQGPSTFHVFPQVADGLQSDMGGYFSELIVMNVGAQTVTTCTIRLYGPVASRISGPLTMTIAASGGIAVKHTASAESSPLPLATGYGTLSCDQPVAAQVEYIYVGPIATSVSGAATVFSSPSTTRAELFVANTGGFRSAVAIANNTDAPAQYQVKLITDSGQLIGTTDISVAARSNVATFFDQLIQFPDNFVIGAAIITSASTPFSAVGLLFNGSTFSSTAAVPFGQ